MEILGKKTNEIVKKTKKFCIDTTFVYPFVVKRGEGCYLESVDGKRYLDFNSNVSSCNVGYDHPEIMKVLKERSKISPHKIAGQDFFCEEQAALAEKLVKITPKKLRRVFLSNSGAEAVENAIKFVYRKRGPLMGISCSGAFHGRTLGALTFTFTKPVHKKNYPQLRHARIKFCTKDDDADVNKINGILKRQEKQVAFVISEVVQGEGGYNVGSRKFVKNLRSTTKEHGIPLIIDEIQSGMGRTGKWWAFEHYAIEPEIMAAGKSLQVGATISSKEYDPKERGAVSSTWGGGHRMDMAVALKTIEIIEKEKLMLNAKKVGRYFMRRLEEIREKCPDKIMDLRGLGLMIGVEFFDERMRDSVVNEAFKRGLLLLGCGFKSIRIAPPLIISEEETEKGLKILENVLTTIK